jgi:hypothetical protein
MTRDRGFESLCIREDAVLGPIFDGRVGHRWGDHLAAMVDASRVGPLRDGRLRSDRQSCAFLDLAGRAGVPILAIYGDETPRKSLAEMDALSTVPGVDIARLPRGKLSLHEEFAEQVARESPWLHRAAIVMIES